MKVNLTDSTTKRKCFYCGKNTGHGMIFKQRDVEIRVPVCVLCEVAQMYSRFDGFKATFPMISFVLNGNIKSPEPKR